MQESHLGFVVLVLVRDHSHRSTFERNNSPFLAKDGHQFINCLAYVLHFSTHAHGLQPTSDGLQPTSDGLQSDLGFTRSILHTARMNDNTRLGIGRVVCCHLGRLQYFKKLF